MQNGRSVSRWGIPVSNLNPTLMSWVLVGSEDEEEKPNGSGDQGSGDNPQNRGGESEGGNGEGSGGDESGGEGENKDTFDRAYVEKLRKEAADYRTRAKAAEDELNQKKKEEMSDLEKAQTEAEESRTRASELESELDRMRLQMAVTAEATAQNFYDPEDALSLIDRDSISKNDEGVYNKQSVQAAVKRLSESKPHLVKGKVTGSGDGGARGQGGGNMTDEDKRKQLQQEYAERGGVPIPKL